MPQLKFTIDLSQHFMRNSLLLKRTSYVCDLHVHAQFQNHFVKAVGGADYNNTLLHCYKSVLTLEMTKNEMLTFVLKFKENGYTLK